jgi:hypothetical protein
MSAAWPEDSQNFRRYPTFFLGHLRQPWPPSEAQHPGIPCNRCEAQALRGVQRWFAPLVIASQRGPLRTHVRQPSARKVRPLWPALSVDVHSLPGAPSFAWLPRKLNLNMTRF